MIKFVKDSFRELRHVVWPTRKETQKFFWIVLWLIVLFGIYLFIFSQAFSELLFTLKDNLWTGQAQNQMIDSSASDIFIDDDDLSQDEALFEDTDNNMDDSDIIDITDESIEIIDESEFWE